MTDPFHNWAYNDQIEIPLYPLYYSTTGLREYFFINKELIANQQAYKRFTPTSIIWQQSFYCPECGEVWGQRLTPEADAVAYKYVPKNCKTHGGDEIMLTPMELENPEIVSKSVLAYLFLKLTEGNDNAI